MTHDLREYIPKHIYINIVRLCKGKCEGGEAAVTSTRPKRICALLYISTWSLILSTFSTPCKWGEAGILNQVSQVYPAFAILNPSLEGAYVM